MTHALDDAGRPITVVGAGTLGRQIAALFAARETAVRLYDPDSAQLARGFSWAREQAAGLLPNGHETRALDLQPAAVLADALAGARLVIEAVPEDLALKRAIFAQLDALAPPDAVLGTNSSSFKSSLLIAGLRRPERVLNIHFYNGVWNRPAVEVMSCGQTDPDIVEGVIALLCRVGLEPFLARRDSTGFIYNRIWAAIKREALAVVVEGVATPDEVDRIWAIIHQADRRPFLAMDANGLDIVLAIEEHYAAERPELPEGPRALLRELVAQGKLGVKSGEGFYRYPPEDTKLS